MKGEKRRELKKKHVNFYTQRSEVKNAYFLDMPTILHVYLEEYFNFNDLNC